MDIGKAFGFVFEDERWFTKLLIGAAISLLPFIGQIIMLGYLIAIIRNVLAGNPTPLPEWDDIGQNLVDGVKMLIVNLIYALPILIPLCLIFILPFVLSLPAILFGGGGGDMSDVGEALTAILGGTSILLTVVISIFVVLYGLLLWLLAPAIRLRFARYGEIGPSLRIGEVFRFTFGNIGPVLIVLLMRIAINFLVGLVVGVLGAILNIIPICGQVLFVVVIIPIAIWQSFFYAHLVGQVGWASGLSKPV